MDFDVRSGHQTVHKSSGSSVFRLCLMGILAVCLMPVVVSCKKDLEIREESLYGKWEITRAARNGKETQYLRGGYFVFQPDGMMIVNITGSEEKGAYTLSGQSIDFNNEKVFDIISYRSDTLGIRYPLSHESLFEFYIARKKDENK